MWTRAALAALLLAATPVRAVAEEKAFAALDGTFWRLEAPPPGLEHMSIGFHDGMMIDAAPCEFSDHQFALEDGRLAFRGLRGAGSISYVDGRCGEELDASNRFDWQLSRTAQVERKDDKLVLIDEKGVKTVFTRIVPDGVEYRRFAIAAYRQDGRMVHTSAVRQVPTILFAEGQLAGETGCIPLYTTYVKSGDRISGIAIRASTSEDCGRDALVEGQRNGIAAALRKARRIVTLPTGEFELRDGKNRVQATLAPYSKGTPP
jgi:hypothetical protein